MCYRAEPTEMDHEAFKQSLVARFGEEIAERMLGPVKPDLRPHPSPHIRWPDPPKPKPAMGYYNGGHRVIYDGAPMRVEANFMSLRSATRRALLVPPTTAERWRISEMMVKSDPQS